MARMFGSLVQPLAPSGVQEMGDYSPGAGIVSGVGTAHWFNKS